MSEDIYVYLAKLPPGVNEIVAPCEGGGYCVYVDADVDEWTQIKSFRHALSHIENGDFDKSDVQLIECECHCRPEKPLEYYMKLFGERVFQCGYVEVPKG